jgi:hypothetical protein
MGLFDTVKLKANALAADAERAGKVTAAQARTVVLQNDIRKAERELGHGAFSLIEGGEIAHPDLETAAARLREARQTLKDKETEIAELRHGAETGDAAAPAPAETVADTAADAPLRGPEAEAPHTAEPQRAEPATEPPTGAAEHCAHCSGTLEAGDAFCRRCGQPAASAPTAATQAPEQSPAASA